MKKFSQGFTLFELLVVISIIGIITAVGMISYSSVQKRGRDARRKEDLQAVQKALEQYYVVAGQYPGSCYTSGQLSLGGEVFLEVFPTDPKNSNGYQYESQEPCDSTGYAYRAHLEVAGSGNAFSNCSQTDPDEETTKDYFCVKSLQ